MASNNRTHIPAACTTTHLIRPLQRTIRRTRISAADRTHIPWHLSYYTTASHVLIRLQTSALTTMCAAALSAQVRPLRPTALASLRPTALTSLPPVLPLILLDHCSAQSIEHYYDIMNPSLQSDQ